MKLMIPELSLILLVGASGSGKSSFGRKHFKTTEVISSDFCRGLVSDDENDQTVSKQAFEVVSYIASRRLELGKLTVIDATNVQQEDRKQFIALARSYHVLPVAIVFNLPPSLCYERNQSRPDRAFGPHVVRRQSLALKRSLRNLKHEGFNQVFVLNSPEDIDSVEVGRQPLWNNKKSEHGPFDIIGDIHGCYEELQELLLKLGYVVSSTDQPEKVIRISHPEGRKVIFLGDLVDRGPDTPNVLRLVMGAVTDSTGFCVPGNHDAKFLRKLKGKNVKVAHGLTETLEQMEKEPAVFQDQVARFIDGLVSHYVLDDGKLVVAHAGMKESMQGRGSGAVREFALYGETTGETDEFGLPIRYNWAAEYHGRAAVVYGHTPVMEPEWLNNTVNIDTGCVFGGKLTALRYPEREFVSVPSRRTYAEPAKPFLTSERPHLSAQQEHDDLLDMEDVSGKRIIATRLARTITVNSENAVAALEVMSRFAANPKWLIYLPPTMSPSETSSRDSYLEHPAEAFVYFAEEGVRQVICEQKHMGSRAVVIVCKDEETVRKRFGLENSGTGICYTRTGRQFFDDPRMEQELLERVRDALTASRTWEKLETDWVCLDCELMPWSVKAQSLIHQQYAAVGAASRTALSAVVNLLEKTSKRIETSTLLKDYQDRAQMAARYVEAYRRYCWPVESINDLKLAPFHLLASQGQVHTDKDHLWHMEMLAEVCKADEQLLLATPYMIVDTRDPVSMDAGIEWWEELTGRGGEGMVVKPLSFIARGLRGLVQPAVKCRGAEYLRIIYGPEYDRPENLSRLRRRGLARKRSLAVREFALGLEALERFVEGEPLRRVHECVFGVLAMESESVDPRL